MWIKYKNRKPPVGKKVNCFADGDVWVGMYFGGQMVTPCSPMKTGIDPDLWQDIDMPDGFTGRMRILNPKTKNIEFMDEFVLNNKECYKELCGNYKKITPEKRKGMALEMIEMEYERQIREE
jgi:hypothetical protein